MKKLHIGFLHPGAMGISLAASAQNTGHTVCWASEGRSNETRDRAEQYNLVDMGRLARLCENCSVIVSICPPHAAEDVANQVLSSHFRGVYVDANAISPDRVKRIGRAMTQAGVAFLDGCIIGPPAWEPGRTWLHLSGNTVEQAVECFAAGPLETVRAGPAIGTASALKMCYAALTKGTTALLCAILSASEAYGVRDALEAQWDRTGSDLTTETHQRIRNMAPKAWRYMGEMAEITATFSQVGMPGDFHAGAGEIYRRLSGFKDVKELPAIEEILTTAGRQSG